MTLSGRPARKRSPSVRSCALDRLPADRLDVLDGGDEARRAARAGASRSRSGGRAACRRRGPHLVRTPASRAAPRARRRRRGAGRRTCTASRSGRRRPSPPTSIGPCGAVVDGVRPRERAGVVRELDDAAHVRERADCVRRDGNATTRVRSLSCRSRSCEIERRVVVDVDEADRRGCLSCASSSQGETFASWSSLVTMISSPCAPLAPGGARERECERRHVRAEDAPRPESQPRNSPAVETRLGRRAPRCAGSSRTGRSTFAFDSR